MKNKKRLILICILISGIKIQAQTIKGLYVDGFSKIIGKTTSEDSLLNYAQFNGYNYLALYDLWPVHQAHNLTNVSSSNILANFIQKAKQNYGILQIGAVGENFYFFNNVINIYNQKHTNVLQKFDVYNVEFEFWNNNTVDPGNYYCSTYLQSAGYSCDTSGAFKYYRRMLVQVDSIANKAGVISETYVGWFNQDQGIGIANIVDRILLHDYISSYNGLCSYIQSRLQYLAARKKITQVIPIFSAEPSFMGPWLKGHSTTMPYNDLQTYLANENGSWKQYINLSGYQWFTYSFMPYLISTASKNIENSEIKENIYPNPASEFVNIRNNNNESGELRLYDLSSRIVLDEKYIGTTSINIEKLAKGTYLYINLNTDGTIKRGKIIKI